jgi:hypothetical protein
VIVVEGRVVVVLMHAILAAPFALHDEPLGFIEFIGRGEAVEDIEIENYAH